VVNCCTDTLSGDTLRVKLVGVPKFLDEKCARE
jgi:hypothetical protein